MKKLFYSLSIFLLLFVSVSLKAQLPEFNQFNTQHGYIKLGPINNSFAHFYTDKPRFFLIEMFIHIMVGSVHTGNTI